MADQALHWPGRRGSRGRRGAAVPIAVVGSIAFHVLVLGYLALRALSDESPRWTDVIEDPLIPDAIPVELVPFTAREGRHVRVNRVVPHKDMPLPQVPAELSPDFHPPEPGRRPMPQGPSLEAQPRVGVNETDLPARPDAGGAAVAGPTPFPGRPRTSALACRNLTTTLTLEEQAICDERFGRAAMAARTITGTDDPVRDARFAAEGQAELDAYEALRAPLKPRTPCEGADMMGRCPFVIQIPLFSRKF
ncbi:hypothetical protein [Brevundimonas goettingensis]|uniref:Uncharacterized protein n=1 Tax=Brevundimonas goettingensis TaxID=2774190 RepID=A0A975C5N2_9CAUL|nr:hypothetical protein [Brevundimonas goettingensis]QTC92415.1 hypothetical protein IFJ75_05905 [Brevundimonas goettingensis]